MPINSRAHALLHGVRDGFLDLFYPPRCLLCPAMGCDPLCSDCLAALVVPVPKPFCARCGQPLQSSPCVRCRARPPEFVRARAMGLYADGLREAIHHYKYRNKVMLAGPLAELLAEYVQTHSRLFNDLLFDAIVPVPLHPARRRQRGYDQCERLALALSPLIGVPARSDLLTRRRDTRPQVGLEREARLSNLTDAFAAHPTLAKGKVLLLLDDVTTTGSTVAECSRILIAAGAKGVFALTLAMG